MPGGDSPNALQHIVGHDQDGVRLTDDFRRFTPESGRGFCRCLLLGAKQLSIAMVDYDSLCPETDVVGAYWIASLVCKAELPPTSVTKFIPAGQPF